MPEGPEVKIIANELNILLNNAILNSVEILSGKYCHKKKIDNFEEFNNSLPLKILYIKTKGKMIYFKLDKDWYIFNTLGMSGTWSDKQVNHCHIQFNYTNESRENKKIWFFDIRRFGNIYFSNDKKYIDNKFNSIGPDMLSNPPTMNKFKELLKTKNNWNICKALMDQNIVSGIGNYIKSEVLFNSRISPFHKVIDLSDQQIKDLYKSIIYIINKSYNYQGTTLSTYRHVKGTKGDFSNLLEVYNKKLSKSDNYVIEKVKTPDGRSTFWVPTIQK